MPTSSPEPGLGSLGLAGQLRLGLTLGFRNYLPFALIALVVDAPIALAGLAGDRSGSGLVGFLTGIPLIALINPVGKAAVLVAVRDVLAGGRASFTAAYRTVLSRGVTVAAASVLWLAGVALGIGALVVPGVVILIGGQCLMGAIVLERLPVVAAARRSWQLVRPAFLPTLALFLILEIGNGLLTSLPEAGFAAFLDLEGAAGWPVAVLLQVLLSPFVYACLAVYFLDRQADVDPLKDQQPRKARQSEP